MTTTAPLAVGVLVAAAVWLAGGPRPPRARLRARAPAPRSERGRSAAVRGRVVAILVGHRRTREADIAAVLTEVASRLRAGAPVAAAWRHTLDRRGLAGCGWPGDPDGMRRPGGRGSIGGRGPFAGRAAQLAAVRAAVRLAEQVGAPLADVLDRCAGGIAEAGRAEAARRIALAGPVSTARMLSWLPLGGLLLGWGLGADPLATMLDGGPGTAAALAGLGLLLLGRRWTAALVAAARRPGDVPRAADPP